MLSLTPQDLVIDAIEIAVFLLVAFPVHEFAHAFVAYQLGDGTAKMFGRLTLNPVVHFDPVGGTMTALSILIGGFLFGWAKPTPYNPSNLRDRRNGEVFVALAGPASNLIMASLAALLIRVLDLVGVDIRTLIIRAELGISFGPAELAAIVVYLFVQYNVLLFVFNLIPIPPLDGSSLLYRVLDPRTAWQVRPFLNQYGIVILFGFVFLLGPRIIPPLLDGVSQILVGY